MLILLKKLLKPKTFYDIQKRRKGKNVDIFINGTPVSVPSYFTILQALRQEGVACPTFCYHERLSIAGNCRMCLVRVEGMFKPQIACGMPVMKNMKIYTNSLITQKAQEGVLEFILANHPLDCPICDQGGECDLQDLSMRFGNDRTRFTDIHFEGKRAVEDKYIGPLIRTVMTRCIQCTRCIRFASQVCGIESLGTTGRGAEMLVGTYVDKMFLSELSGNIIDLCPVGALTAIPYQFKARPWEIKKTNSIDVTDATGTNIVINHRFDRVLRVLPRENEDINQEWLSDKGRWAIDSLEIQRLITPMLRHGGTLRPVEWDCALKTCAELIKSASSNIIAIAGSQCNAETLVAAKDLINYLGSEHTYIERNLSFSQSCIDIRSPYCLNIPMKDIAKADKILLIGTNPRFEAPILNARIGQAYLFNECDIYAIGPPCQYNYHVNYLGEAVTDISGAETCLKDAKRPLIFIGIDQLQSVNAVGLISEVHKLASSLSVSKKGLINVIAKECSFAAAFEVGWKPGGLVALKSFCPKLIISLGADDVFCKCDPPKNCPVIYIGFQGDRGAECASIVLPGSAYTESGGIFMNMEFRPQFAYPGVTPPGNSRYDWTIIRALSEYCKVPLCYNDFESLCCRMVQISPNLVNFGIFQEKLFIDLIPELLNKEPCDTSDNRIDVDMKNLNNYYCSDIFTCNSPTMVKATKAATDMESATYARN